MYLLMFADQGTDLDRGVTRSADYTVTLGNGRCEPEGQLLPTSFRCSPPRSVPRKSSEDEDRCNNSFALMVTIFTVVIIAPFYLYCAAFRYKP